MESELQMKHPFGLLVSGSTSSGKSEWITRLIENRDRLIDTKFDRVIYHYGIFTKKVLYFQSIGVETVPGMPDEKTYFHSTNKPIFLIMDDLMLEASSEFLTALFTRASHHCNISTAFITQNLFEPKLKVPRQNTQYFVFLRNPANQLPLRIFAAQVFPKLAKFFNDAYIDATKDLWGYLFVDLNASSPPSLRLRTNIFDKTIIYCS